MAATHQTHNVCSCSSKAIGELGKAGSCDVLLLLAISSCRNYMFMQFGRQGACMGWTHGCMCYARLLRLPQHTPVFVGWCDKLGNTSQLSAFINFHQQCLPLSGRTVVALPLLLQRQQLLKLSTPTLLSVSVAHTLPALCCPVCHHHHPSYHHLPTHLPTNLTIPRIHSCPSAAPRTCLPSASPSATSQSTASTADTCPTRSCASASCALS